MKQHQDGEYLRQEIANGETSRSIAKKLRVSWKLVEAHLKKNGVPFKPYERQAQ
jgi:FixJ family two-component response regulator